MKRSTRCLLTAAASLSLAAFVAPATAQTSGDVPSYSEFKASTYRDTDRQWIVNGDEPIAKESALQQYYNSMVSSKTSTLNEFVTSVASAATGKDELIINTVGGRDDKWTQSQVGNLTYCVSNRFGTQKAAIVNAMSQGAALWENVSSAIDFRYVSSQDSNCSTRNSSVVFSVEPSASYASYIARAFFPSTPKSGRNVLVNVASLRNSGSWGAGNIMGHELGHTLGFRHEHTRPEAGTCYEDSRWRPLTPYDSASIMHYPQCNGSSSTLRFSSYDARGVRAIYGY